jgi:hypothetical protein
VRRTPRNSGSLRSLAHVASGRPPDPRPAALFGVTGGARFRGCPRLAQFIAPQLRRLFQAVKTLEKRFDGGHVVGLAPFTAQSELNRDQLTAGALNSMCVEPVLVVEQGAKQQRNLPMIISFGTRRKRSGIAQNVAPMLNKFRCDVERLV